MYKKLETKDVNKRELNQIAHWNSLNLLEKSVETRKDAKPFIFFEGPPTANGKPGIHHVVARSLKDAICRYKTMNGYQVKRKAGWDTHGLPVEIEVEKKLGLKNKQDIEKYGIEKFNRACKESVFEYESIWRELTERMAYLIDLDDPYITLKDEYIESVWWILSEFFNEGLIYEGYKILPYCSRCGTGLASHEVSLGYKDRPQETVTVAFKRKDVEEYFLVWTTTPWTLAANVVLTVHPDVDYVRVKQGDTIYILAKDLATSVLGEDYEVLDVFKGRELEYVEYEPIMDFVKPNEGEKAYYVTLGEYVTTEDGTGIVHTAPAFGEDDYNLCQQYKTPVLNPVNDQGKYTQTPWKGMFVMDADELIVQWLKDQKKLYKKQRIVHSYPHCWRCGTPLLYYAHPSWYIEMTKLRNQLIENNNEVHWHPDYVGEKRFGNWLENLKDWAISRSRYWGTPLNIWQCECSHKKAISSKEELLRLSEQNISEIELHRPYVDDITIPCEKCGKSMKRVEYVIDVWFDSGAMPFAQWHYPFENKEDFDQRFPADFICEGIDQTRGWFYSLLAISSFVKGKAPYKNVLVNDMLLDKEGKKMSKSKGNIVDPFELFKEYGADALRWYLSYVSPAWAPTKFDISGLREVKSKFFGTVENIYYLLSLYANTDGIVLKDLKDQKLTDLDQWILSKYNRLIQDVTESYEAYDLTSVTRSIQEFVNEDFSNWYIRRSRRRFWKDSGEDKLAAYQTTYEVLIGVLKMAAPIAPFMVDEIYQNLTGEDTIHLSYFPVVNEKSINEKLEKSMDLSREIVTLGRAARESEGIKVRQPLHAVYLDAEISNMLVDLGEIIKEELNVKTIVYAQDPSQYINFSVMPNFPVLGPQLGSKMGAFQKALRQQDQNNLAMTIRKGHSFTLEFDGDSIELSKDNIELRVQAKKDYSVQTDSNLFVIMDAKIDEDLLAEGYARELVSTVQNLRKESGFEVSDRIILTVKSTPVFDDAMKQFSEYIQSEVLANEIFIKENNGKAYTLNEQEVMIQVEKDNN